MEPMLDVSQWKYQGEGMEHLVLKYIGEQQCFLNKTLIINKQDYQTDYNDSSSKQLNAKLLALHLDIISHIKNTSEHLLSYQKISFDALLKKEFIKGVKEFWLAPTTVRKRKQNNNTIDQKKQFRICDNLFQSKMSKFSKETAIIQFKPKSILFTKYLSQTISKLAEKLNISVEQIDNIVNTAEEKQKTKWFKVCLKKPSNKLSPLGIFNYSAKNYLKDSLLTIVYKNGQLSSLSDIADQSIYDEMINRSLKECSILQEITKLQLLYNKPYCYFLNTTHEDLLKAFENANMDEIKKNILSHLSSSSLEFNRSIIDDQELEDDFVTTIVKLLISTTWRDISTIIQSHIIDVSMVQKFKEQKYHVYQIGNSITAVKITIIDYNIKPISRAQSHSKKQVAILENYLLYKLKAMSQND